MLYSIPFPVSKEKNCVKNKKKKRTERYLMKYVNSDVATGNFCKSCQNMGGKRKFHSFFLSFPPLLSVRKVGGLSLDSTAIAVGHSPAPFLLHIY